MSESAVLEREVPVATNYRVAGPLYFGDNVRGTVLPKWVAELSGSFVEQLVADGTLEETHEPVTKSFRAPDPKGESDTGAAMAEEMDRLRRDNTKLRGENKALAGENAEFRRNYDAQVRSLGEQTAQVTHWRGVAEGHAVQVVELETQLEIERAARQAAEDAAKASTKPDAGKRK